MNTHNERRKHIKLNNEIRDYIRKYVSEKYEAAKKPLEEEQAGIHEKLKKQEGEICGALNAILDAVQPKLNAVCKKYGIETVEAHRFEYERHYHYSSFNTKRLLELNKKLRELDNERFRIIDECLVRASLGCDYDSLQELLASVKF